MRSLLTYFLAMLALAASVVAGIVLLKPSPFDSIIAPKRVFTFHSKIPGYRLQRGHAKALRDLASEWGLFAPLGIEEAGNPQTVTARRVKTILLPEPVVPDDDAKIPVEFASSEGGLIANSTMRVNRDRDVVEVLIYVSPDWLANPATEPFVDSDDPQLMRTNLVAYHFAMQLFESSTQNLRRLVTLSAERQGQLYNREVFVKVQTWQQLGEEFFPVRLRKKRLELF